MNIDNIVSTVRQHKGGECNLYEGYITYYRKSKAVWSEYSKIKRLTEKDAFSDALDLREHYFVTNKV